MSAPSGQVGRPQLVEAAGAESGIDPAHAALLRTGGAFFWLDLDCVPPGRMAEFSAALGLDADSEAHLANADQRSAFTETDGGFRWVSYALGDNRDLTQIRAVFTRAFLVTVHDQPCPGLDDARSHYQRLRASEQDDGPLVLFMVLDALVNTFESVLPLLAAQLDGATVTDKINDQVARIGEKIQLARFERIEAEGVAAYIHGAYRMGVLVGLSKNSPAVLEAGKDIAMQIAAMNPVAVDPDSVPADIVSREKAIVTEQIKNDPKMAGKPDEMIDKIATRKLNAFFKENSLTAQAFVKDAAKTVGDYLKGVDASAKVTQFKRVQLG